MRATAVMGFVACAAMPARAEGDLPEYPGAPLTEIGGLEWVGKDEVRAAYFVTADPLRTVAGHFLEHWRRLGIPATVDGDKAAEVVVTAFLTREKVAWSVCLQRDQNRTLGFSSRHSLRGRPARPSPEVAPLEGALWSETIEGGGGPGLPAGRVALFSGGREAVLAAVDRSLERSGLRQEAAWQGDASRPRTRFEHVGSALRVSSVIWEAGEGLTAVVQRFGRRPNGGDP